MHARMCSGDSPSLLRLPCCLVRVEGQRPPGDSGGQSSLVGCSPRGHKGGTRLSIKQQGQVSLRSALGSEHLLFPLGRTWEDHSPLTCRSTWMVSEHRTLLPGGVRGRAVLSGGGVGLTERLPSGGTASPSPSAKEDSFPCCVLSPPVGD